MNTRLSEYIENGMKLDEEEREVAALALQHVNEMEQAKIDDAWDQSIDRRLGEILDGSAQLIDGRESLAQIRAELAARRA